MEKFAKLNPTFQFSFKFLSLFGIYSTGTELKRWKLLFLVIFLVGEVTVFSALFYNFIMKVGEFQEFVAKAPIIFAIFVSILKMANFRVKKEAVFRMVEALSEQDYRDIDGILKKQSALCTKYGRYYFNVNMCLILFINVQILFFGSNFDLFYDFFPVIRNKVDYYIVFVLEMLQIFILAVAHLNIDLINYSTMWLLEAHLECITVKLQNIPWSTDNLMTNRKRNVRKLKGIIEHHVQVLKIADLVKEAYMSIFYMQISVQKLALCTLAYELSDLSLQENPFFFIRQLWLSLTELFLVFVPNYFADRVTSKSSALLQACYDCSWYEQNQEFKKLMIIFQENLKNPIRFRISRIFELNLEKFLETCNAIYSFYTILKQL